MSKSHGRHEAVALPRPRAPANTSVDELFQTYCCNDVDLVEAITDDESGEPEDREEDANQGTETSWESDSHSYRDTPRVAISIEPRTESQLRMDIDMEGMTITVRSGGPDIAQAPTVRPKWVSEFLSVSTLILVVFLIISTLAVANEFLPGFPKLVGLIAGLLHIWR